MAKISWWEYVKMLFKGKEVVEKAVDEGKLLVEVNKKSTWKTSEFWCAALASLGAISAQAAGIIPPPYGAIVASASVALYAISRGLAKNGDPLGGVKPSLATTEFWANVLVQVGNVLAATSGAVDPKTAATLMIISNSAYGLSRGLAKGGAQPEAPAEVK